MKLPEREIQKSLSILKGHHFLSALQEQGKSASHCYWFGRFIWESDSFRDALEYGGGGEKMLVSMATDVMETSVALRRPESL